MRSATRLLLLLLFLSSSLPAGPTASAQSVTAQTAPPVAAEKPVRLEKHGHIRTDPYFWLRERDDPEVLAYLDAENAYFEARMAPLDSLRTTLFEEIKGRIRQDDASVPYRLGDHYYYYRYEEGSQYRVYARKAGALDAPEEVLLDVNEHAGDRSFYSAYVSASFVSPSGRYVAWVADTTGRRFYTIRFLDTATGRMLGEHIPNVTGNLAWANDDRTLFYTKQDPVTLRWDRVYRHVLGTPPADDVLVFTEADDTFSTYVTKTKDDAYLLIASTQTLASEWRFLGADDPAGTFRVFAPRRRGHEYGIEHANGHFYVRTNRDAPNFRLMRTPDAATAEENWEEVLPHRDDVLLVGFEPFRDFLVVTERADGLDRLLVHPWDDPGAAHHIAFEDAAYDVSLGANPRYDEGMLRFVYQSPTTPETTYDYDMTARTRTLRKRDEVLGGFDSAAYRTERLSVPARDGARVPVTLVYREDRFGRDGTNPLLLYGYGSYGASIPPYFDAERLSLLDRGFVYAIAHIRGSETLGRRWYEDGKLLKKKNTFTDFIDAAEHLAAQGYADPERMYAMGGSAGGLLMGAVMNMRPDLFDGIIAHVPWVDVVTTMLDDTVPLTTSEYDEWGNPNDPAYYQYMLAYSPYDNVAAVAYPHLLVTTALNDSQVQYWEPAKWVARLRKLKTDDRLLMLYTDMGAGHGGASGRYDRYRETARDYAFFLYLAERPTLRTPRR